MRFIPNGHRVLVKSSEEEQKTSGGFIIPTKERGELLTATVVAVGNLSDNLIGKVAFFKENDGVKINVEGESYLIVENEKVLGFL